MQYQQPPRTHLANRNCGIGFPNSEHPSAAGPRLCHTLFKDLDGVRPAHIRAPAFLRLKIPDQLGEPLPRIRQLVRRLLGIYMVSIDLVAAIRDL